MHDNLFYCAFLGLRFDATFLLFLLRLVSNHLGFFDMLFEQQQQIVGEAFEDRMAFLGLFRTGPRFALVHLAFEFVEYFLDIPAVLVKQYNQKGWHGEVVGQVSVGHVILGIDVNDAP